MVERAQIAKPLREWVDEHATDVPNCTGGVVLVESNRRYTVTLYGKVAPKDVDAFMWAAMQHVPFDMSLTIRVRG